MLDFFSNSNISNKNKWFYFCHWKNLIFFIWYEKIHNFWLFTRTCFLSQCRCKLNSLTVPRRTRWEERWKSDWKKKYNIPVIWPAKYNCFINYITKSFFIQIMQKQRKSRKNRLIKTINWWNTQQIWEKIFFFFFCPDWTIVGGSCTVFSPCWVTHESYTTTLLSWKIYCVFRTICDKI